MFILQNLTSRRYKNTLLRWKVLRWWLLFFNFRHFLFHHRTNFSNMSKTNFRRILPAILFFILVHNTSKVFTLMFKTFLAQIILLAFYTFIPSTNDRINFTIVTKISMMNVIIGFLLCILYPFFQLLQRHYSALRFVYVLTNVLIWISYIKKVNLVKRCIVFVLKIKAYFFVLFHIACCWFLVMLTEIISQFRQLIF